MVVKVEKQDLLTLISKTQNIVEKRNTMPILSNVLIEAKEDKLKVFATDLEVSLTAEINAEVSTPGNIAVSAKNLLDIVRELGDGMVQLTKSQNNWMNIKQNKSNINIVGTSADEFPIFPAYSTKEFVKIQPDVLREMIEKTIYSVSNDETRYHLNGVYFEQRSADDGISYRMVATDGHRLSLVDRKASSNTGSFKNSDGGVIVPRKGLQEMRKLLDSATTPVEMAIEGSQFVIKSEGTVLMIRLIDGKYPNYQQLIPQNLKKQAKVSKDVFTSCLRRVSLLSNQKSKSVTLSFTPGSMQISSNNPEIGDAKEEIEIDYSGDEIKIGFNAKYLLDILNCVEDDEVRIELNDQLSPGLIRPKGDSNYTCVVMPMRI